MKRERRSPTERRAAKRRRRVLKVLRIYGAPSSTEDADGSAVQRNDLRTEQNAAVVRAISDYLFYWQREADWPGLVERVNERLADLERKRLKDRGETRSEQSKPSGLDEAADVLKAWKETPGQDS